jgi:hypothetical protein
MTLPESLLHDFLSGLATLDVDYGSSSAIVDNSDESFILGQYCAVGCTIDAGRSPYVVGESSGLWGFGGRGSVGLRVS